MPVVKELKNIPPSELQKVIDDFQSEGLTVEVKKQPDGNYTVIATKKNG